MYTVTVISDPALIRREWNWQLDDNDDVLDCCRRFPYLAMHATTRRQHYELFIVGRWQGCVERQAYRRAS